MDGAYIWMFMGAMVGVLVVKSFEMIFDYIRWCLEWRQWSAERREYERCKRANGILLEDAERRRKDWYASRR